MQVQQRLLKEKEMKIRKALERLKRKRRLLGTQRRRRELPVVAVVGYTNSGERSAVERGPPPGLAHFRSRSQTGWGCDIPRGLGGDQDRWEQVTLEPVASWGPWPPAE